MFPHPSFKERTRTWGTELADLTSTLTGHFSFGYDALSRRTSLNRPNAVNTAYSYDGLSHLLSVLHQAGSTTLDGASYVYDYAGNRNSKTTLPSNVTEGYTYDPLYELTNVTKGGATSETYGYDAVGNRLSSLGVPTYNYNPSNELTSNSTGSYTYDNNGNTLTDPSGKSYTWDFENRLTQVVVPGTGTVTFKYDPFGRRIQKSGPGGTTNYLYDGAAAGANVIEEVDNSGSALAHYVQGPGTDQPLSELRSGTTSYYQADGLGSISSLSNSTGVLANTYTYDSYGKLIGSTGTVTNPFRYTARDSDSETNMFYYRARYYDPSIGRFIAEDPIRFAGSSDFYSYTQNRPINATDPSGLKIFLCSRGGFPGLFGPSGFGNHAFFYDDRNGDNCGKGGNNHPHGSESPSNAGTFCREVPGSAGHEDDIMKCCRAKSSSSWWAKNFILPPFYDCQTLAEDCLKKTGMSNPGVPGGRMSCRGNCSTSPASDLTWPLGVN